ncbi:hypothetical protein CYMTET_7408 [Cymbomonas tetramitiformis]|uniref:DM2 domain-containing protein n=1 Tax=Cymbomonas tetramitiformis TaxID=36881 RepID=A0AAE0GVJ4_9CHLO|nr:hypothetical protein CYMTET_7408 [Cymbomonas tetramitiformis]
MSPCGWGVSHVSAECRCLEGHVPLRLECDWSSAEDSTVMSPCGWNVIGHCFTHAGKPVSSMGTQLALILAAEKEIEDEEVEEDEDQFGTQLDQVEYDTSLARVQRVNVHAEQFCVQENVLSRLHVPYPYNSNLQLKISLDRVREVEETIARSAQDPNLLTVAFRKEVDRYDTSPVIYGQKYTTFGRHFTTLEKLEMVTNQLLRRIRPGDCIVDFSCGSNEFIDMMENKIDQGPYAGSVSYAGYDILPPVIHRHFQLSSWFDVRGQGQHGTNVVLGLNPPFGVKNSLAIQFIEHGIQQFLPVLIVLIVPPDTQLPTTDRNQGRYKWINPRTGRKENCEEYEIVWEDTNVLDGTSFYLPGSVGEQKRHNKYGRSYENADE